MTPTLERYCEMQHLVVSLTGDTHGFVDNFLAQQGIGGLALRVRQQLLELAVDRVRAAVDDQAALRPRLEGRRLVERTFARARDRGVEAEVVAPERLHAQFVVGEFFRLERRHRGE